MPVMKSFAPVSIALVGVLLGAKMEVLADEGNGISADHTRMGLR